MRRTFSLKTVSLSRGKATFLRYIVGVVLVMGTGSTYRISLTLISAEASDKYWLTVIQVALPAWT